MAAEGQEGFYSSTSGTYFTNEAALKEHYQSDLHRYNLKRKVAGLPPVTKEWFDARKEQLTLTGGAGEVHKVINLKISGFTGWLLQPSLGVWKCSACSRVMHAGAAVAGKLGLS